MQREDDDVRKQLRKRVGSRLQKIFKVKRRAVKKEREEREEEKTLFDAFYAFFVDI